MANCKNCGKEFVKRNAMQLFCTTQIDGKGNCRDKHRFSKEKAKRKILSDTRLDELSILSAKVLKNG